MCKNHSKNVVCCRWLGLLPAIWAVMIFITACSSGDKASSSSSDGHPSSAVSLPAGANLTVTIFDTGKSDCILIETEDGAMMIDTASSGDGKDIVKELEKRQITKLDYLLITHLDKDHVGGAEAVIEGMEIGQLIQADYDEDSKQYTKYQEACRAKGLTVTRLREALSITLGGASLTMTPGRNPPYEEDNDYSIITSLNFGETCFLFAGDAEEQRLSEFIADGEGDFDYLKVPHHGRYNEKSTVFMSLVKPETAVITCSAKDMPEPEILQILEELGSQVYLTENGTVTAQSDGKQVTVNQ